MTFFSNETDFVDFNYQELRDILWGYCRVKKLTGVLDMEEVESRFFHDILMYGLNFDPSRGTELSTWLFIRAKGVVAHHVRSVTKHDNPQWASNIRNELLEIEVHNDPVAQTEADLEADFIRDIVVRLSLGYVPTGCLPKSFKLRVFDALVEGRKRREITKKFGVSEMRLSKLVKEIREEYERSNGF